MPSFPCEATGRSLRPIKNDYQISIVFLDGGVSFDGNAASTHCLLHADNDFIATFASLTAILWTVEPETTRGIWNAR